MFNGKNKAITFSYDDCTTQDIRLVKLFDKYGVKGTFNANSNLFGIEKSVNVGGVESKRNRIDAGIVKELYKNHEVAVHTLDHVYLQKIEDCDEVVRQIEQDREALEALVGYNICGMAYPFDGNGSERVAQIIKNHTEIRYARTVESTYSFDMQENLLRFNPTVHHSDFDNLFRLGEEFVKLKCDKPQLFYVWGHSYEFDIENTWDKMEEFLKLVSGRDDIFYGTNKEVLL